jgi:hypothetical protein
MSIKSARAALNLVGKKVCPAPGSEWDAFSCGKPQAARVIDVYMPDISHPYVVVKFQNGRTDHMYPFELIVVPDAKLVAA